MTTNPDVPTVIVRAGDLPHAVAIRRPHHPDPVAVATNIDNPTDARRLAADIRGALADAYHAGRADAWNDAVARIRAELADLSAGLHDGTVTPRQYLAVERLATARFGIADHPKDTDQ